MVDLAFLKKFTKGNVPKMKRYISMYLDMAPATFDRMRKNIDEQSWHELAVNAHSLKPQAEYMGIATLKDTLMEIESRVKNNQTTDIENLFEKAFSINIESANILQEFVDNN